MYSSCNPKKTWITSDYKRNSLLRHCVWRPLLYNDSTCSQHERQPGEHCPHLVKMSYNTFEKVSCRQFCKAWYSFNCEFRRNNLIDLLYRHFWYWCYMLIYILAKRKQRENYFNYKFCAVTGKMSSGLFHIFRTNIFSSATTCLLDWICNILK